MLVWHVRTLREDSQRRVPGAAGRGAESIDDVSPLWDRESMSYDDPVEHLLRTNDGREGFCQILTTTLLVGGTYPKWGTHNALTDQGVVFFKALDGLSFGTTAWTTTPVFIDEITMPKRHDDELSASPDWTLVFEDRVWMIELKTERGSHRATQLPHYLDMAAHHYPGRAIDVTYLTGPLVKPAPRLQPGQRYAHLTWEDTLPLYQLAWGATDDPRVRRTWPWCGTRLARSRHPGTSGAPPSPEHPSRPRYTPDPVGAALRLVDATASDHAQRALDHPAHGAQELHDLRLVARDLIRAEPAGSPRRHVRPRVWSPDSTGMPLTVSGRDHGLELRFRTTRRRSGSAHPTGRVIDPLLGHGPAPSAVGPSTHSLWPDEGDRSWRYGLGSWQSPWSSRSSP